MEVPSEQTLTSLTSLLEWINTFEALDAECEKFEDLCSGSILLACLSTVFPDVDKASVEPWTEIWNTLEGLCGCTLGKAVSLEEVLSGNQEHVARVVVLLLCFAVQKKPNDDIIAGITSLDTKVQRDLKFFIESTIAQVTSHAIVAGTFQSGIGEPLPSLEVLEHPEPSLPSEFQPPDADDGVSRSSSLVSLPRKDSQESFCFPTPRRPSRQFNHGKFYNGLNSPAGVKWLQSPGITRGRSMGRTPLVSRVSSTSLQSQCVSDGTSEEVSILQHRLRVLDKRFKSEKAITEELSAELQLKTEENENLEIVNHQLEAKAARVSEFEDVRDELEQSKLDLSKAEKALVRYRTELESLQVLKETVKQLEKRVVDYESIKGQLQEHKKRMITMDDVLEEKSTTLKRLELAHQNTLIELQAKSNQQDSLLQQNIEVSKVNKELVVKCQWLEEQKQCLETDLQEKFEEHQSVLSEKRALDLNLEALQTALSTAQEEVGGLNFIKTDLETKAQEAMAEQKEYKELVEDHRQTLQNTNEDLKTRIKLIEGDLESEVTRTETLDASVRSLKEEIANVQVELASKTTEVEELTKEKNDGVKRVTELEFEKEQLGVEIESKTSDITSLTCEKSSLEKAVEELTQKLIAKEGVLCSINVQNEDLHSQTIVLQKEVARQANELATTNTTITELNSEKEQLGMEIESKTSDITTLTCEKSSLEKAMEELTQELSQVKRELVAKEDVLCSVNVEKEMAGNELSQAQVDIKDLRSQTLALQQEVACQADELTTRNSTITELNFELESVRQELRSYQTQMEESRQTGLDKDEELSALSSEKAKIEKQVLELEVDYKSLASSLTSIQEGLSQVETELASKTTEVEELTKEKNDGVKHVTELEFEKEQLGMEIESKTSDITSLTCEKSSLEKAVEELTQELKQETIAKEGFLCSMNTLNEETAKELSQAQADIKDFHSQTVALKQEVARQANELATRSTTITELNSEKEQLGMEIESKTSDITTLTCEKSSLEKAMEELTQELSQVKRELITKEDVLCSVNVEKEMAGNELSQAQVDIKDLRTQTIALKQEVARQANELTTRNNTITELNSDFESVRQEVEENRKTTLDRDEQLTALSRENAKREKQVIELQVDYKNVASLLTSAQEGLRRVEAELVSKEDMVANLMSEKDVLLLDTDNLKAVNRELISAEQTLRESVLAVEENLKLQVEGLSDKLQKDQEAHTAELQRIRDADKQLLSSQEETFAQLKNENNTFLRDQANLYKQLNELLKEKEDALSLSREYVDVVKEERAKCVALEEQIEELEAIVESNTATSNQNLEENFLNLQQEVDQARKDLAKQNQRNIFLTSERKSVEAQLAFASQKLRDLEKAKSLVNSPPPSSRRFSRSVKVQKAIPVLESTTSAQTSKLVSKSSSDEDFYSIVDSEFDQMENRSDIPVDYPSSEDDEVEDSLQQPAKPTKRATLGSVQCLMSKSSLLHKSRSNLFTVYEDGDQPQAGDAKNRVGELQRRNKLTLPHLKSSYPIEMQVKPDSPSVSNEMVKNGSQRRNKRQSSSFRQNTGTVDIAKPTAFMVSLDNSNSNTSAPLKSRKRARERSGATFDVLTASPNATRRRTSAPPTPQSAMKRPTKRLGKPTTTELRRSTFSSFKLREFLDETTATANALGSQDDVQSGTAFEVAFSPPKANAPLPKRFQAAKKRTVSKVSAPSSKENTAAVQDDRRQTIVKSKHKVPGQKPRSKNALKRKN